MNEINGVNKYKKLNKILQENSLKITSFNKIEVR